jgi:serine/threonine protein kinase
MSPEILVKSRQIKAATFEDLKKIDIWAFGMVMFNLLNPNLKYPYQLDVKDREISVAELLAEKKLPTPSIKYKDRQNTIWKSISLASAKCLQFDPSLRPAVKMLKDTFQRYKLFDTHLI